MEAAAAQFDMKKLQGCAAAASTTTTSSVGGFCFKSICVFCGSSSGNKTEYQIAMELGTELVQRKVGLICRGGSIGLMGKIAETVHTGGSQVTGVIPRAIMGHETIGELILVDDEHHCKVEMARLADAFIALPGGSGSLEQLMEINKWLKLCSYAKPVGLLNVNGYYDPILALFDQALEEGFLNDAAHHTLVSAPTPKELMDKMEDKNMPKLACLGGLLKFYHK